MNRLVLLLFVIGAVSAQRWGYNDNNGNNGNNGNWEGHAPRRNFVPAPLAHDGRVVDTPEIVQAKAAHFAAHDAAAKAAPLRAQYADYAPQNNYNNQNNYNQNNYNQNNYNNRNQNQDYDNYNDKYDDRSNDDYEQNNQVEKRWRGPPAKIEFTQDGKFIKDTPEVAHAKQQHLAALAAAKQNGGYGYEGRPSDEEFRGEDQHNYNNNNNQNQYNNNQNQYNNNGGRYEDDGQYRGEGSGQYNRRTNWQGQANQYNDRPQGNRY